MQREIGRALRVRQEQRHRLGQIADAVVALIEQPLRYPRLFHRPTRESPNGDEPLRPAAAQKPDRPRGIGGLGGSEVLDHRVHLLVGPHGLVDRGEQSREPFHAGTSSPATSTGSVSSSPFHRLAMARASMPRSVSQRTSGSRVPCVTHTRSAPVPSTVARMDGQSTWSDKTKPRSSARRRRAPRTRIHPDANAVEMLLKRRSHVLPAADGGATTRLPPKSYPRGIPLAYCVSASLTPPRR